MSIWKSFKILFGETSNCAVYSLTHLHILIEKKVFKNNHLNELIPSYFLTKVDAPKIWTIFILMLTVSVEQYACVLQDEKQGHQGEGVK